MVSSAPTTERCLGSYVRPWYDRSATVAARPAAGGRGQHTQLRRTVIRVFVRAGFEQLEAQWARRR